MHPKNVHVSLGILRRRQASLQPLWAPLASLTPVQVAAAPAAAGGVPGGCCVPAALTRDSLMPSFLSPVRDGRVPKLASRAGHVQVPAPLPGT